MQLRLSSWVAAFLLSATACSTQPAGPTADATPVAWAIAIHGGAGSVARDVPAERKRGYLDGLEAALRRGAEMLEAERPGLEVVEAVIRILEDDPLFNAGRGAVFNHDGGHELDASIMDGESLACGAVAAVRTVKHPITLARHVMLDTAHVLLVADGAERFADETDVERVDPTYFDTPRRRESWRKKVHGTVGAVVLDRHGNLAAGTSTGGLTGKLAGRVGDSPIVGAGTYADNRSCAVSGTGRGEEFIRHSVARSIAWHVEQGNAGVREAAERLVHSTLRRGDGGVIVVGHDGSIAMVFSTDTMLRGAADANGRFEVGIWKDD